MRPYIEIVVTYLLVAMAWFGAFWLFTYPPEGWDDGIFYRYLGWVVILLPFAIIWGAIRGLLKVRKDRSSK